MFIHLIDVVKCTLLQFMPCFFFLSKKLLLWWIYGQLATSCNKPQKFRAKHKLSEPVVIEIS